MLDLDLAAGLLMGLLLALTRVAAFVVASPLLARLVPAPGRVAVTVALGFALAAPVEPAVSLPGLLVLATANAAVGLAVGWLTGVLFQLFAAAGGLVDLTSGISVSSLFDPTLGDQAAVYSRLFNQVALALFYVLGGVEALVRGLALSVEALPLDGAVDPQPALADVAVDLTSRLLVLAIELALPLLSALFLTEVVLGLAGRLAPQANVFLLGLPLKLLLALTVGGAVLALFPGAMDSLLAAIADTFRDALRGLMPAPP